jgi:hypothetical protein
MTKSEGDKMFFPVSNVTKSVFGGTMMLKGTVTKKTIGQVGEGIRHTMTIKPVLFLSDLSLDVGCPVVGLLLSIEVVAYGRMTFDADDSTPASGTVFVFTLIY